MPRVFDQKRRGYDASQDRAPARPQVPQPPAGPAPESRLMSKSEPAPEPAPDHTSPRVAIARLLHAVAYEEIALARLMQAEVAKVERLTSQTMATPTFDEIIALQRSAADVVHRIVRKEEILLEKLNVLLSLVQAIEPLDVDPPQHPGRR